MNQKIYQKIHHETKINQHEDHTHIRTLCFQYLQKFIYQIINVCSENAIEISSLTPFFVILTCHTVN